MQHKYAFAVISIAILCPAAFSIYFEGDCSLQAQPCEIGKIAIEICNDSGKAQIASPTASGERDWFTAKPESVEVRPGACEQITVFAAPDCMAKEGKHSFEIYTANDAATKKACELAVGEKFGIKAAVEPGLVSAYKCSAVDFLIMAQNSQNSPIKAIIAAQTSPENWIFAKPEEIALQKGQAKQVKATVAIPCETELSEISLNATAAPETGEPAHASARIIIMEKQEILEEANQNQNRQPSENETASSGYTSEVVAPKYESAIEISKASIEENLCIGEKAIINFSAHNSGPDKFSGRVYAEGIEAELSGSAVEIGPGSFAEIRAITDAPGIMLNKKIAKKNLAIILSSENSRFEKDFTFDIADCGKSPEEPRTEDKNMQSAGNGGKQEEPQTKPNEKEPNNQEAGQKPEKEAPKPTHENEDSNISSEDENQDANDINSGSDNGKPGKKLPFDRIGNAATGAFGLVSTPSIIFAFLIAATIATIFISIYKKISE